MALGKKQIETLAALGSPGMAMVVPDKIVRSLVKRGLMRTAATGGFGCITAAGLRVLADEMEAGRVEGALEWAARERAKNEAALRSGNRHD